MKENFETPATSQSEAAAVVTLCCVGYCVAESPNRERKCAENYNK